MKQINLRPYQDQFIFADEFKYKFMKAGWATGKSLSLILACIRQCEMYPDNLGVIYRKEATDLRDSTIKQFENLTGMKVDSQRDVTFSNGSTIMFRHSEEVFGTVQNINLGFAGIEEHAELDTDDLFYLLFGRLRRANTGMKMFSVGNANGHNWVYKIRQSGIFDPKTNARMDLHLSATTFDNAENLSQEFLNSLEILKVKRPKYFNRFVMNSDDEADTVDIIIQPAWIYAAASPKRELNTNPPIRKVVSIDVARYGDDKTIFYALENNEVVGREEWEKRSTMETCGLALHFAKKHGGIESFAVDEIGVGAGVADRLRELEKDVVFVNAASKSNFPEQYYNLRAEIYSQGAEKFEQGKVKIQADDTDLIEQLAWAKYKTIKSNGIYQVEAKEDIKKRYGRSPDNADCYLNGLWALSRINPEKLIKRDKYLRHQEREPVSTGMTI